MLLGVRSSALQMRSSFSSASVVRDTVFAFRADFVVAMLLGIVRLYENVTKVNRRQ